MATTMMSEEEKAEMERELNEGRGPASPPVASTSHGAVPTSPSTPPNGTAFPTSKPAESAPANGSTAMTPSPLPSPDGGEQKNLSSASPPPSHKDRERKKSKITPEQKKKLQELEEERRKNMEERIEGLTKKLVDRLRPFVHAKHPGDKDDPETQAFEAKMRLEAEDMKLESFGVEVSHSRSIPAIL